jgi:SAM-dependent methyltransferase
MPARAEPPTVAGSVAGDENPGGSQEPFSDDLRAERRRYERHGGDHVARYRWAAEGLRGARVLDVGCGHGFGALFLTGAYREYVGVDVDRAAVDWAKRVVAPTVPRASFAATSSLPSDGSFDAVTCFEVLEHVADPRRLLAELGAAAAPGAPVFLSTPNGTLSDDRPGWYMSPFHLAEYSASQFEALVSSTFDGTGEYFAQYRVDRLDWLPQAFRRQLAGPTGRGGTDTRGRTGTTPAALKGAHEWFRKIPSPSALWRRAPLPRPLRDGLGYSHLLWTGRRRAAPTA